MADAGYVEQQGELFLISKKGSHAVEKMFTVAHQALNKLAILPENDLSTLYSLLKRLVEATLSAAEPPSKLALQLSRWTHPKDDSALPAQIEQYLTDLNRFRDDAHFAALKPYQISGHAWEIVTLFWRGEINSMAQMRERLVSRGFSDEADAVAVDELIQRGWLEKSGEDSYQITDEGKTNRNTAEQKTDGLFFVSWSALTQEELTTLYDLLNSLKEALQIQLTVSEG